MTLLAAHKLHEIPVLIGDAICTAPDSRSLKKKIYLITPNLAYPHEIDLNQVRTLTFDSQADFYVHHFVLHFSPVEGLRLGMCIVGDETSDKVSIIRTDDRMRFHVNTGFLNEKFREAIRSVSRRS